MFGKWGKFFSESRGEKSNRYIEDLQLIDIKDPHHKYNTEYTPYAKRFIAFAVWPFFIREGEGTVNVHYRTSEGDNAVNKESRSWNNQVGFIRHTLEVYVPFDPLDNTAYEKGGVPIITKGTILKIVSDADQITDRGSLCDNTIDYFSWPCDWWETPHNPIIEPWWHDSSRRYTSLEEYTGKHNAIEKYYSSGKHHTYYSFSYFHDDQSIEKFDQMLLTDCVERCRVSSLNEQRGDASISKYSSYLSGKEIRKARETLEKLEKL